MLVFSCWAALGAAGTATPQRELDAARAVGNPWLREAVQHASELREQFHSRKEHEELIQSLVDPTGLAVKSPRKERLVLPGHATGSDGLAQGTRRRRLATSAPILCPTAAGGSSSYGAMTVTSTDGTNKINLWDEEVGYGSDLFCQWTIAPSVSEGIAQEMSLIFEKFDVPVGYDVLRVYQLKCDYDEDGKCARRVRQELLAGGFPADFSDAGQLPPIVHATEPGNQVQMQVRFSSKFATGAAGFLASYTISEFDLLDATPILMPERGGTAFALRGAGFAPSLMKCQFQSATTTSSDFVVIAAESDDDATNSSLECKLDLVDTSAHAASTYIELIDEDPPRLRTGTYELSAAKAGASGNTVSASSATIFVYSPPTFGAVTPSYAAYGTNCSLALEALEPWDPAILGAADTDVSGLGDLKLRFVTTGGAGYAVDVALDVPAEVSNAAGGALPLQLSFLVPMPLVGGELLANASQVQVSLNGQQYEATSSYFQFHEYCSGRVSLSAAEGELYDHPVEQQASGPPRPYSFCSWAIEADPAEVGPDASADDITIALQIQAGSQLLNVGYDHVTVHDGTSAAAPVLLRWPESISAASTPPATVESSANGLLLVFTTGGFSGDAAVYQGFSAKYVATARGALSLLSLSPAAAPTNSSGVLTVVAAVSADLLQLIRAALPGQGYQCLFTSTTPTFDDDDDGPADDDGPGGADDDDDGPVGRRLQDDADSCVAGEATGSWTEATLAAADNNTFTCALPAWDLAGAAAAGVQVALRGAVASLPCAPQTLALLVFATPELEQLEPGAGAIGTRLVLRGSAMLDPAAAAYAEAGVVSVCRFGGSQVVTAEWLDNTTVACDAPTPTQPGPNPTVDVEVSNNGYDWSVPLPFTYETYCGNTIALTQSVGSFTDHSGGGAYSLPNSYCDFLIAPTDPDTGGYEPGGVELTFDSLDIGPADTVLVYRTGADGLYELLLDVGAYFSAANSVPPSALLKSGCGEGCSGLPVKVEFRTGVVSATSGIGVSYVTLEAFDVGGEEYIYCAMPTLACPAVVSNFGFSASESTRRASLLQLAGAEASGSVQVAGMVMHYLEVDAGPASGIARADDYRIVEIELRLQHAGSAAALAVVRQQSYANSTEPALATDEEGAATGECADTTRGQSLEACPSGDYAADEPNYRSTATASGDTLRLVYCLQPDEGAAPAAGEKIRLLVGVYGVEGGAGTDVVPYYIQYHELPMQEVLSGTTLSSLDSSFVSGGGASGGIGWTRISTRFIPKLTASMTRGTGRLLLRALACPTEAEYDYAVSPVGGAFGLSIAQCEQAAGGSCSDSSDAVSDAGSAQQLWFLGLYSEAGVDAANASNTAEVAISGLAEHGASVLCAGAGAGGVTEFTDDSCANGLTCTHLLAPLQTHHFLLQAVAPDQVLKVDACITTDPSGVDGDSCLGEGDGLLAVAVAPAQGGLCLSADSAGNFSGALLVDGAAGDSGLAQGHYRLSRCTVGYGTADWLVSVTSRADAASSFLPYRLNMYYQSSPALETGQVSDYAYAGDWNFYFVTVSDTNELSVILEMPLAELNFDNSIAGEAALQLYLSEAGCPSDVAADNRTAVLQPIRDSLDGTQRYYVTQTPWPGDCYADGATTSGTRLVYIGVYGADSALLRPEGSLFSLTLGEGTLALTPDTPREVAVQAGQFVVLQVEVSTLLTFNVNARVLAASDDVPVEAGALEVHLMPKYDRDADASCGWPVLQARLNGADSPAAATASAGQSALPLSLMLGTVDAAGTLTLEISVVENVYCGVSSGDSIETWYVALRVPGAGPSLVYADVTISQSSKEFAASDAKEGAVLAGQWAHFLLETSTEGTISLNVDIGCFGNCEEGAGWLNSLLLVAQQDGDGSCPDADATTSTADSGGSYLPEGSVRFSVNLCTGSGGVYRVGLLGETWNAQWEGGALGWTITSESVEQENLASYSEGEALEVTLASGQWQYHYFELPDPTCADSNCLADSVTTAARAAACQEETEGAAHSVDPGCKADNALFPADISLQVSPIGGSDLASVNFYVVLGDCSVALSDWSEPPAEDGMYTVTYDSMQLIDEYVYAQLSAIQTKTDSAREDGLAPCEAAEVVSCAQCAKRSASGACEDARCCFIPKIYVGFEGLTAITTEASYQLTPALSCTAGYRAAGGTYASACEPCPEGTYSTGGQLECLFVRAGYFSVGGQATETPCEAGSYSSAVGQSECKQCELGTFQESEGQKSCDPCAAGFYSAVLGADACEPCPETFTSREGSIYLSECFCQPNYYREDMQNAVALADACLPCPDHAICRGGCQKTPSANDCSEPLQLPEGASDEQRSKVMGGLTWIPMAMPYPAAGYYQPLDADFVSPDDAPPADCERTGPGACWWPLLYEDGVFVSCSSCRVETATMKHNNLEWQLPWWSHDPSLTYPDAALNYVQRAAPFGDSISDSAVGRSLFQCQQGSWTYDDTPAVGCTTCLALLYYTKGSTCVGCDQDLSAGIIVLGVFIAILVGVLLVIASKVGFNWAAISISINFLQVSAIFANFSIEWPPEVLALLDLFNFFVIDVEVIQAECNFRISYFEKWITMVLLPFILFAFLAGAACVLSFASYVVSHTRFPLWLKRKLYRHLRPPSLVESFDPDEELAEKIKRKAMNLKRKLLYLLLSLGTKPIPRQRLEQVQDVIFNAFVTLLSVYYMTGCKRSLEIFRCVKRDPVLWPRAACPNDDPNSTAPALTLVYKKQTLEASEGSGEVICGEFNFTTCTYTVPAGPMTQEMLTKFLGIQPFASPNYTALQGIAAFFVTLYAVCIPLFFFVQLQRGKHKLNHLTFGRRYGYLYKRYEVEWFWWECTVMVRKLMLSAVDIFIGLANGGTLPGQQAALGMSVVMVFLMAQAAAMPYVEPHLDALESLLLVVNYTFLFLGLCDYAIGLESAAAPDQQLKWILTVMMTAVLIIGVLFMILFLALDITLQLVRLYFRFIEGEGKYGARQQLVLTDLSKEARKVQALGSRLLGSDRMKNFQDWLNRAATEDEKILVKAAFTSLANFLDTHQDHSMPWYVQRAAAIPLLGGAITWCYQKQHKYWLRRRAKRIRKQRELTKRSRMRRSSAAPSSDSMGAVSALGASTDTTGGASGSRASRTSAEARAFASGRGSWDEESRGWEEEPVLSRISLNDSDFTPRAAQRGAPSSAMGSNVSSTSSTSPVGAARWGRSRPARPYRAGSYISGESEQQGLGKASRYL